MTHEPKPTVQHIAVVGTYVHSIAHECHVFKMYPISAMEHVLLRTSDVHLEDVLLVHDFHGEMQVVFAQIVGHWAYVRFNVAVVGLHQLGKLV